jgi:hypothetical protein
MEKCLKLLLGVCNTKTRCDLSISLSQTMKGGGTGHWCIVTVSTEHLCAMLNATSEIFVGSPCVVKIGLTFFENKILIQSCWLCLFIWHILCTLNLFQPWGLFAKLTVKSVDGLGENNNIYAFVTMAINTKYLLHIEHVLHREHRWRRIKI